MINKQLVFFSFMNILFKFWGTKAYFQSLRKPRVNNYLSRIKKRKKTNQWNNLRRKKINKWSKLKKKSESKPFFSMRPAFCH